MLRLLKGTERKDLQLSAIIWLTWHFFLLMKDHKARAEAVKGLIKAIHYLTQSAGFSIATLDFTFHAQHQNIFQTSLSSQLRSSAVKVENKPMLKAEVQHNSFFLYWKLIFNKKKSAVSNFMIGKGGIGEFLENF